MNLRTSLTARIVVALVAGLVIGAIISASGNRTLSSAVGWIEPLGELWVNAIRMTVVPLVVALLIGGVASVADISIVGRLGARTLLAFVSLLALVAVVALIGAPLLFSLVRTDAFASAGLKPATITGPEAALQVPGFSQWLISIIPTNPVKAAADGAMLPLVVFSILFALSIMKTDASARETLLNFFHAIGDAMLTLVRWVVQAAPVGVFALALSLSARVGASVAGTLGLYILIICGLYLACTLLLYPIAVLGGHVSLRKFAKAISPAQAVALTTRSSLASLPALLEAADRRLVLPPAVSGFALPLSVAVFKVSTPITQICATLFVSRLYGVPISPIQLLTIAALSVVLSFTSPGIPSGGLLIMAPVLASVGLPAEGVGILIAVDIFPDAARTLLNVTADAVVATIVASHSGEVKSGKARADIMPPAAKDHGADHLVPPA
jgi:Na+/H+-dicarboxylate symporter